MKNIKQKGLTIIEALISTALIGIGFIAIFQMVNFSVTSINTSGERTKANFLSSMIAEGFIGYKDSIGGLINVDKEEIFFKDGKKVKMSTRSGEFFTLKNLIEDIGSDAARFYYLSKQADQHLDFDLDLAKSDSKENIFYYIQYAHARIVSLEEKALDKFSDIKRNIKNISSGSYKECDNLIHEISKFPDIVNKSANTLQPHVIIYYLKDLSQLFHSFYNDNHVLSESEENIQSILECLIAVKQVISNGLNLLGITPMKKM